LKRFTLAVLTVCVAGLTFGCQKSSVIGIPPPQPSRLYVSAFGNKTLSFFSQPFSPTETPTVISVAPRSPIGMAVDSGGNLYMAFENGASSGFSEFAAPISSTSTPVDTVIAGAGEPYGALVDRSGNLFISDASTNKIYKFTTPATSPTLAQTTAIASFNRPEGMSLDLPGNTFVAQEGNGTVVVLPPNFGVAPVPVGVLTLPVGVCPVGVASDVQDRLFVADTCGGNIQVYTPPWGTATRTPAFEISPPGVLDSPDFVMFDTSGNLYVTYESSGNDVAIFLPPFSGGSFPSFQLMTPDAVGEAFAP
jgi:sugar lactone lactonase YvrE